MFSFLKKLYDSSLLCPTCNSVLKGKPPEELLCENCKKLYEVDIFEVSAFQGGDYELTGKSRHSQF